MKGDWVFLCIGRLLHERYGWSPDGKPQPAYAEHLISVDYRQRADAERQWFADDGRQVRW